jgi:SH3-like domain-containing protein
MRTNLGLAGLALMMLLAVGATTPAAAQVVEGEEHCVINVATADRLKVRSQPDASASVVGRLRYGQCGVIVTGNCAGAWCPIEDGRVAGWINSRFISMVSPSLYCVTDVDAGDRLNVRAYPSTISRILTRLPPNQCDIAFLPYAVGSWQKIRVVGYEGWVNRRYLSGE